VILTFPTPVQLSQYNDANLPSSTVSRVLSDPPDVYWRLDRSSTDTIDNIVVCASLSGVGRWLKYSTNPSLIKANFDSPANLIPGNATASGTSTHVPRADHVHGLPPFGSASGTFAQGNDSRFTTPSSPAAAGSPLRANGSGSSEWASTIQFNDDDTNYGSASANNIASAKRRVQTTNATPTVLHHVPIPTGYSGDIFATVIACRSTGATFISEIRFCYKNVDGIVSNVGSGTPTPTPPQPSDVALTIALTINGTGIDIVATGDVNTWWWSVVCQTTFNRHT
jgi:hypothetical protein